MELSERGKIELMSYYTKFCKFLSVITFSRKIRNHFISKRLQPYEFTVFSNNCIGGVFVMTYTKNLIRH